MRLLLRSLVAGLKNDRQPMAAFGRVCRSVAESMHPLRGCMVIGTIPSSVDSRGMNFRARLRLVRGAVRALPGESAECALVAVSVVGALDRGHDRQAVLGSGGPASPVEHVALQKGGEPLHGGVVPPWTGVPHRSM